MREKLQPGDRILDRAGNVAVRHPDDSGMTYHASFPYSYFKRSLEGEIAPGEYVKTLAHFVDIQAAYDNDEELPEGAVIVPDLERQFKLTRIERINLKVLPLFTDDPS